MSRRTKRIIGLTLTVALAIATARARAADRGGCAYADNPTPVRIRALSPTLQTALQDGRRRSPLLASLVERIDRSDGLVLLMPGGLELPRAGRLLGGLSHRVIVGPNYRLLRIVIWPQPGDRMIATMAHELRHALEVLDAPEAVDQPSVERLYERIGIRLRSSVFETKAAQRVGDDVRNELARCRS